MLLNRVASRWLRWTFSRNTIKNVNLNDFAQKSIKLLQDKILRRRFSENAKQHVKTNFNLEKSFLVLENIFRETIAKKPS